MISISSIVSVLFTIIIAGLIFWLLWWLVDYLKLPDPFNKVARVILAVAAVFLLISLLLSLIGHPIIRFS